MQLQLIIVLIPSLTRSISRRLFAIELVIEYIGLNFAINLPHYCHYFAAFLPENQVKDMILHTHYGAKVLSGLIKQGIP